MKKKVDPFADLPDAAALRETMAGPFARCLRQHPRRGTPHGWGGLRALPWNEAGLIHDVGIDPGDQLDYHTGCVWPQDGASQVPVLLLDPQPGEVVIDCCAAPGSKSTQMGLAMQDQGVLICCDASNARRKILGETLARQGVIHALVTPMPVERLAQRAPACADAVLVDAPCSGHVERSANQIARMALKQERILDAAADLVAPGGRLVYSTCTPYTAENESQIARFLEKRPGWVVEPSSLPGVDVDVAGLGGCRLWPQKQETEPFFAIRLRAPADGPRGTLAGDMPEGIRPPRNDLPASWYFWQRGDVVFVGSAEVAAVALPSEARGMIVGRQRPAGLDWQAWAVQAAIAAGADAEVVSHERGIRLWAGVEAVEGVSSRAWVRTEYGAPLGGMNAAGTHLHVPARMRRQCKG